MSKQIPKNINSLWTEGKEKERFIIESRDILIDGMVHEMSDLLTRIKLNTHVLRRKIAFDEGLREDVDQIIDTVEKADMILKKIMSSLRIDDKGPGMYAPLEVNKVIGDLSNYLSLTLDDKISLQLNLRSPLRQVLFDQEQFEQVLINLLMNAKEAMDKKGEVIIETDIVELTSEIFGGAAMNLRHLSRPIRKGTYVRISVRIKGSGMDEQALAQVYPSVYTTQQEEKCLKLAMVEEILERQHSFLKVEVRPFLGAELQVYIPALETWERGLGTDDNYSVPIHAESYGVLIVEDEIELLETLKELLEDEGYKVFTATNVQTAYGLYEQYKKSIQLIITDVGLPLLSGPELVNQLQVKGHDFKVLYISGHSIHSMPLWKVPQS